MPIDLSFDSLGDIYSQQNNSRLAIETLNFIRYFFLQPGVI